ncbi:AAA family ATPase [Pandoraea terrigena]|uniref:Response regulator receiver protein n=1 Tax=Pandoraea terrigena TaxID=2508292 RepID=A0A5E4UQS2_9BURK|nr:AAA family ATPase [Pandoraea terrigena]VVE02391.1 response regulator receiver protein [Pandoraea terrigena]
MLKVLLVSQAPDRLALIARLARDRPEYDCSTLLATPAQLLTSVPRLGEHDVAVIDLPGMQQGELHDIQMLCQQMPKLVCILVSAETSPALLISAMRAGARDVLPWPVDQHALADALARASLQHGHDAPRPLRAIAFMSCKGGAGTSFVAANASYQFAAQTGSRVLLIDLAQEFGDAAFLVSDKAPPATLPDVCAQVDRIDASFLEACVTRVDDGFDVLAGAGDPVASASVTEAALKRIIAAAASRYDLVVFDIGQILNPLSLYALRRSDHIYVVLRANMPFLRACRRLFDLLRRLGIAMDTVHYVLNRAGRHDAVAAKEVAEVIGKPALAVLPDDSTVADAATSQGVPVLKLFRRSALARALGGLASIMADSHTSAGIVPASHASLIGKLFRKAAPGRPTLV